jgi:hypothetical protein
VFRCLEKARKLATGPGSSRLPRLENLHRARKLGGKFSHNGKFT